MSIFRHLDQSQVFLVLNGSHDGVLAFHCLAFSVSMPVRPIAPMGQGGFGADFNFRSLNQ